MKSTDSRHPPIVFVALLHAIGVYLFVSGFLLTRKELSLLASCNDPQASCPTSRIGCSTAYAGPQGCSTQRTVPNYRYVLLLIVDAIRFDFIPQFQSIERTLRDKPSKSRVFDFVADAPTTTMQRLKALTTGGLPTFVDMGRSFEAGIDIQEDNWVHQAMRGGHEMRVVGDDTWVSLYPEHRVSEALPFPSLNVKDIDGCDEHVMKLFPQQLEKAAASGVNGSSIVVGHFLGVDHIGHRFGIEHPEMGRKVQQLDKFWDETREWAEETSKTGGGETLLMLFGDHGQTVTGDHGGATAEEVESFLFAFSTADLISDPFHGNLPPPDTAGDFAHFLSPSRVKFRDFLAGGTEVSFAGQASLPRMLQSDFVPTLCMSIGIPIPFGNLGAVAWTLLASRGDEADALNVLAALRSNAMQVQHFLVEYQTQTANALPADMVGGATRLFEEAEALFGSISDRSDLDRITNTVAAYRSYLWYVAGAARQAWATFDEVRMAAGVVTLLVSAALSSGGFVQELRGLRHAPKMRLLLGGLCLCVVLHCGALFSNSYIVHARAVTHYLTITVLLLWGLTRARTEGLQLSTVVQVLAIMALSRGSVAYTSLVFEKGVQEAGWTTLCALLGMALLHAVRFLHTPPSHPRDLVIWSVSVVCVACYWALQLTQQLESAPALLRLGLPRTVYALTLAHGLLSLSSTPRSSSGLHPSPLPDVFAVLAPAAALVLGAGSALCVAIAGLQVRVVWSTMGADAGPGSRLVRELLLCLLATQLFYSSGHRPTFEGVQYGAAFQGIDDVSVNALAHTLAGVLTVLNAFGSYILMVPVCFRGAEKDGGVVLFFFSLTLAMTVVFVGLTRRHLMVWAIFAPKMVYDVIIAGVVDVVFLCAMGLRQTSRGTTT